VVGSAGLLAADGVDLDVSSLADHVGAGAAALAPLHELICRHVLAADRLHGDDTTVPVLARGKQALRSAGSR
jgi:transposase